MWPLCVIDLCESFLPLDFVNEQVKMIVENIVSRSGILPFCTKIVATHNKALLGAADHVVVMRCGEIVASGPLNSDKVAACSAWYIC